jgi:hypothetical protein
MHHDSHQLNSEIPASAAAATFSTSRPSVFASAQTSAHAMAQTSEQASRRPDGSGELNSATSASASYPKVGFNPNANASLLAYMPPAILGEWLGFIFKMTGRWPRPADFLELAGETAQSSVKTADMDTGTYSPTSTSTGPTMQPLGQVRVVNAGAGQVGYQHPFPQLALPYALTFPVNSASNSQAHSYAQDQAKEGKESGKAQGQGQGRGYARPFVMARYQYDASPWYTEAERICNEVQLRLAFQLNPLCKVVLACLMAWCHFPLFFGVRERKGEYMTLSLEHLAREVRLRQQDFKQYVSQLEEAGIVVKGKPGDEKQVIGEEEFYQLKADVGRLPPELGGGKGGFWEVRSIQRTNYFYRLSYKVELSAEVAQLQFNPFAPPTIPNSNRAGEGVGQVGRDAVNKGAGLADWQLTLFPAASPSQSQTQSDPSQAGKDVEVSIEQEWDGLTARAEGRGMDLMGYEPSLEGLEGAWIASDGLERSNQVVPRSFPISPCINHVNDDDEEKKGFSPSKLKNLTGAGTRTAKAETEQGFLKPQNSQNNLNQNLNQLKSPKNRPDQNQDQTRIEAEATAATNYEGQGQSRVEVRPRPGPDTAPVTSQLQAQFQAQAQPQAVYDSYPNSRADATSRLRLIQAPLPRLAQRIEALEPVQRAKFDFLDQEARFPGFRDKKGRPTLDSREALKFAVNANLSLEHLQERYAQVLEIWLNGDCEKTPLGLLHWSLSNNCDPRSVNQAEQQEVLVDQATRRGAYRQESNLENLSCPAWGAEADSLTSNSAHATAPAPASQARPSSTSPKPKYEKPGYNRREREEQKKRAGWERLAAQNEAARRQAVAEEQEEAEARAQEQEAEAEEAGTLLPDSYSPPDPQALWQSVLEGTVSGPLSTLDKAQQALLIGSYLEVLEAKRRVILRLRSIFEVQALSHKSRSLIKMWLSQEALSGPGYDLTLEV